MAKGVQRETNTLHDSSRPLTVSVSLSLSLSYGSIPDCTRQDTSIEGIKKKGKKLGELQLWYWYHFPFRINSSLSRESVSRAAARMGGGGGEPGMSPASGGKRGRDPEEDVYVDNLHSHKRYLSEIMASSLNGLSVGDSIADNIMVFPVRPESTSCFRDELISQYSPMSEDSDDCHYYDTQVNNSGSQTDAMSSPSTSPISSPHRFQKPHAGFSSANPYPLPSCSLSAVVCSNARRGAESEGRFPSSPNDMCHGGDLRRTALLRSVQMRVHGPHAYELSFSSGHEHEQERAHEHSHELEHEHKHVGGVEVEGTSLSCPKSIQDEAEFQSTKNCCQRPDHGVDFVEECSSDYGMTTDAKFSHDKISGKLRQCG